MTDLAVVLVHYRTPELLLEAVRALRRDLDSSQLSAEIVVVDNSGDPGGEDAAAVRAARSELSDLAVHWIDPGANLGYAGGVRRGVEATDAPRIVAMNPDVLVVEGCLGRLLAELDHAAAAGPQFFWDRERRLHLPPTEARTASAELRAALARRFPSAGGIAGVARRAWRRHARRHWEATAPFASAALSGALLAFRRDAWSQSGPMDEGFRLYFEETDWLLRLAAAGLGTRFVPAAHAVHLYAQSSVQEPRAGQWFAEAERRFRRRHFGAVVARLLELLRAAPPRDRPGSARSSPASPAVALTEISRSAPPEWIEIALAPAGFPAAGERLTKGTGDWHLAEEIWRRLPPGDLWIRGVDAAGRESAPVHLSRSAEPATPQGAASA